jgi:hypothetical protein
MSKRICLLMLAVVPLTGVTCSVDFDPLGVIPGGTTLDRARVTLAILQGATSSEATVDARIETTRGDTITLDEGQDVLVNGRSLVGPNEDGRFTRTIGANTLYTITITEPTRGVESTQISAPGAFVIIEPGQGAAASLSGFTVGWSNPDPALSVRITLTQTLFGQTRTREFGLFPDTGSFALTAADLGPQSASDPGFQQGAALIVRVAKFNTIAEINGIRDGYAQVEIFTAVNVIPAP